MAYDLTARLRLKDEMSSKLTRILANMTRASDMFRRTSNTAEMYERSAYKASRATRELMGAADSATRTMATYRDSTGRLRDELGRFASSNRNVGNSFDGIAGGASRARSSVLGLTAAFGGLAVGYGMLRGVESFLESAIGGAANYELATVQIQALFNDDKKAKTYMDRMAELSAMSPILNEQQVYDNSKSFLALTKNQKVLEDMWAVSERLAALDPLQGLSGAVLAQRELAGGDVQSLVERFELPRKVVNQWKNLPIAEQAKAMKKYLDSIGFDQKFLEKTGQTAAKQWDRTQELVRKGMRLIGEDTLTKLKPALVDINNFLASPRFDAFVNTAGTAMSGLFDGLIEGARSAWNYVDSRFLSNPAFANLPDISAKVSFIINDLTKSFTDWYDQTGSAQLELATGRMTKTIMDGLELAAPDIGKSALKIGSRIAISMTSGYLDEMKNSTLGQTLMYGLPALKSVSGTKDLYDEVSKWLAPEETKQMFVGPPAPVKASKVDEEAYHGIDYVPRDGLTTKLHKGETVLPRKEAEEYRSSGGKGSAGTAVNVNLVVNGFTDIEKAAEQVVDIIVRELKTTTSYSYA
ncbi:hypothetical protein GPJ61_00130 [Brevibacillus formosus]|uniref:hypothetical protein n=1 Tax=Brevibacillus formosus TaxID=54913 RepID=UPI001CA50536|nr:hypothetical protein [Brevibacillus formosus]MBW5466280.1 hypothetical protein [Brevibacillus formosus]